MNLKAFSGLSLIVFLFGIELFSFLMVRYNLQNHKIERSDLIDLIAVVLIAAVTVVLHVIRLLFLHDNVLWMHIVAFLLLCGEIALTSVIVMALCALPGGDGSRHREMNERLLLWVCGSIVLSIGIFVLHKGSGNSYPSRRARFCVLQGFLAR